MSSGVLLIGNTSRRLSGLSELWVAAAESGWLPAAEPLVVWKSATCHSPETQSLLADLQTHAPPTTKWFDGRTEVRAALDSSVRVDSPLFAEGTPLPAAWLTPGRQLLVCELTVDPVWGFRGAMEAQAEPLGLIVSCPWFDRPRLLCEAQRLGAADLVVMRVPDSTGFDVQWLVSPSALLLDCALMPRAAHLKLWQQHWLLPQPVVVSATRQSPGTKPGVGQIARAMRTAEGARADVRRAWANRHRIPTFLRRRLGRAEA